MTDQTPSASLEARPDVSFVMPCYNEEEIVASTIRRLLAAFENAGFRLELVAVDNGSRDGTGKIIEELAARHSGVVACRVASNQGYGNGVLQGIPLCTSPWVGIIPADGQVDAEDVVRLYDAVANAHGLVLGKVRRRFRMDGFLRKVISTGYNLFVLALWPRLGSLDVNGSPKILPRDVITAMRLTSKEWFLDPEIMIKAHYMGVRVVELNVFARMRGGGLSHVRVTTCWEFIRKLLGFRFSRDVARWRRQLKESPVATTQPVALR
jgi:dolichol-phosphate mannosyltransferase